MLDLLAARRAFSFLEEATYLNTGSLGLMADPVTDRYLARLRDYERRGLAGEPEARHEAETARQRMAAYFHVSADEITLTGNATDGIALLAAAAPWTAQDEILISDQEHPAMVFPWTYRQQHGGPPVKQFHVTATRRKRWRRPWQPSSPAARGCWRSATSPVRRAPACPRVTWPPRRTRLVLGASWTPPNPPDSYRQTP